MAVSNLVAASAGLVKYSQLFTSSGTFTLPSGYSSTNPLFVDVIIVGGGGGGGAGATNYYGGGGGGSGCGFYYQQIPVYANTTVTIGSGGSGGTVGSVNNGNDGTNGGSSFFGDLQAPGGGFGKGSRQTPGVTYGASLWTGSTYNSAMYLGHTSRAQGASHDRVGGPGGSSGANGNSSTGGEVAGIFGGIGSEHTMQGPYGTYQDSVAFTQQLPISQGARDGGLTYHSQNSGFVWVNPGEGLLLSSTSPANPADSNFGTNIFGFIGKKWWIPGGGGGGSSASNAGTAGTKTTAGKTGAHSGATGQDATANTGGGGGGGRGGGNGGGAGGAGGSGYVLVTYYA